MNDESDLSGRLVLCALILVAALTGARLVDRWIHVSSAAPMSTAHDDTALRRAMTFSASSGPGK